MNRTKNKKVFVGMSGGVDSSVAAFLLKRQGYDVVGVFMRCYNIDGCAERDAEDARRVAGHIGISFYVWDFEDAYKKRVVDYMVEGYRKGITPNPDVACNREIKFGLFLKKARSLGADYVATGHYTRLREIKHQTSNIKHFKLLTAQDSKKDQSYFLWTLTQNDLKHCLFPIGKYTKPQVRAMARKAGLPTAEKKDSQGICFLGNVNLADFLKTYIPERCGAVVTTHGEIIGEHNGVAFYTIGQRHLNIKWRKGIASNALRAPLYVAGKNITKNTLILAEADDPLLTKKEINLTHVHFIDSSFTPNSKLRTSLNVMARVRYRQPFHKAILLQQGNKWKLVFSTPQKYIAPGQSAVFYTQRGEMLGGGIIR